MEKGAELKAKTGSPRHKWDTEHRTYACTDETDVLVKSGLPENGMKYNAHSEYDSPLTLFASETNYDRGFSEIGYATRNIKTVIFPSTIKTVDRAFYMAPL